MKTMHCPASMELSIPSELGYEIIARDAVAAFARRMGFSRARIEDLKTAVCEACINAIEHGNLMAPDLRVYVICSYDDDRLFIEVQDQGLKRYTQNNAPLSISDKLAGLGSLRGMGLLLIAQLTDEAGFTPNSNAGNRFRLTLYRQPSSTPISTQLTDG